MLITLLGLPNSGKSTLIQYLCSKRSFKQITIGSSSFNDFATPSSFLDHATLNWRDDFVTDAVLTIEDFKAFTRRPWVLVVELDAPVLARWKRHKGT
jgi:dCMP deaminase